MSDQPTEPVPDDQTTADENVTDENVTDETAADEPASVPEPAEADRSALDRADESIREARDAEGAVAARDDITTLDDARAGVNSEDPDGEGGHP